MVRVASLAGLLLAVAVVAPGSASGAVLEGRVSDPVDSTGSPAQDIVAISATYDPDAGTWTETIRFHGRLRTDDKAVFYSLLAACGSGTPGDPAPPVMNPASMQAWTDPADASIGAFVGGIVNGVPTWGSSSQPATKRISDDGRSMTLSLTDPLLEDRSDVCFISPFRLSAFGEVFDRVAGIEFEPRAEEPAPGDDGGPPGMPGEGGDSGHGDTVAPTARIARTVVVTGRRRPRLTVSRISERAHGSVLVRRRTDGRVVARGRFRTRTGQTTVKVPLRLAGNARGEIGRRGRTPVTIRVTLTDVAGNSAVTTRRGVLRPARRL